MTSDTLIFILTLVFQIYIFVDSTSQKWGICSLHKYWPASTWNTSVHTSCSEM